MNFVVRIVLLDTYLQWRFGIHEVWSVEIDVG